MRQFLFISSNLQFTPRAVYQSSVCTGPGKGCKTSKGGGERERERKRLKVSIHTDSTPSDPPSLLQAFNLTFPTSFMLTEHVVVVVCSASVANEEGCGHQWRGGGTYFRDWWDRFRQRRFVNQGGLVKALCILVSVTN